MYPDHNVPASEKGHDWLLQYVKAAWQNYGEMPNNFRSRKWRFNIIRDYATGNQNIEAYKPRMGVAEDANETWLNIDWSVFSMLPKFRRTAVNRIAKDYNIEITPIDQVAINETNDYFKKLEAKIKLRRKLEKINADLVEMSPLAKDPKEPEDLEELEIHRMFTYKHEQAREMEQAIKLMLESNDIDRKRRDVRYDLFDFGIAGYKEEVVDGKIVFRKIRPDQLLTSYCVERDFSDAIHLGEIREMTLADLVKVWPDVDDDILQDIYDKVKNGSGYKMEPSFRVGEYNYDKMTISVVDLELISYNDYWVETRIDKRGNKQVNMVDEPKSARNKYEKRRFKCIYKVSYVVGTDYIFNYGLATDMKRKRSSLQETTFSYHIETIDLHHMKTTGIMELIIPVADAIQVDWLKLQQLKAEARPKGITIEIGALEGVAIGSGGDKWHPLDIIDLFNKKGTLIYREEDQTGQRRNYRPIQELENGISRDAAFLFESIQANIQFIRDITGLNEFTDGSTPHQDSLTTPAQMAYEATNNALADIINAEKSLMKRLSSAVMLRLQAIVKNHPVEGYIKTYQSALGKETIDFFRASPDMAMIDFGLELEERPDDMKKQNLLARAERLAGEGMIDVEDLVMIENTQNLKAAQSLLAYKIKKRRREREEEAMRQQQMNGQIQMESAQAAEQAKQATLQLEYQLKMQLTQLEYQFKKEIEAMKLESQELQTEAAIGGKMAVSQMSKQDAPTETLQP